MPRNSILPENQDIIISVNITWIMIKLLPKLFSHEKSLRVKKGSQQEKRNYSDIHDLVTKVHIHGK